MGTEIGTPGLKKANHCKFVLRRPVGVETEIIHRAPADRVRVLILGKGFRVPGQSARSYGRTPWGAAKSGVSERAIVCPSRMLRRRMKSDIEEPDSASIGYGKRLNRPVKVLVIDRILIMPKVRAYVRDFVGNECYADPFPDRARFESSCASVRPGNDGGSHSHRGRSRRE